MSNDIVSSQQRITAQASGFLRRLRNSSLLRNTLWFLGGNSVRLVLQAIYFVLIARALGASQYGAFVGAVALAALVAPFSSWGTGFILIRKVALDRAQVTRYFGSAVVFTACVGTVLVLIIVLAAHILWPESLPLTTVLFVGVSDIVFARLLELSAQVFVAVETLRRNSELYIVLSVSRIAAAGFLITQPSLQTATSWALFYALSGLVATAYSLWVTINAFGKPDYRFRFSASELKDGFYFSVAQVSQTLYNDIDKTMIVKLSTLAATGIYGAAYRIIDSAFAPVGALIYSAFPRFFRHGQTGISGSIGFARRLLPYSAIYGVLATAILFASAPLLPVVLGREFAECAVAVRWLCPLLFLKSIHFFLADSLTGSGHQGLRTSVQLIVVLANVLLNLWLIPAYSWRGAAWASLVTDALLLVMLYGAIRILESQGPNFAVTACE